MIYFKVSYDEFQLIRETNEETIVEDRHWVLNSLDGQIERDMALGTLGYGTEGK